MDIFSIVLTSYQNSCFNVKILETLQIIVNAMKVYGTGQLKNGDNGVFFSSLKVTLEAVV